ncbi:uncharacterized protein LOC105286048 [Ooceraea biroi]|nr:uncharacterized protein LOC105286048 [Ooceraea biroi]
MYVCVCGNLCYYSCVYDNTFFFCYRSRKLINCPSLSLISILYRLEVTIEKIVCTRGVIPPLREGENNLSRIRNIVMSLPKCEMDFAGERYYRFNKILLNCFGLWPSQTRRVKILFVFFSAIFFSFIFVQFSALVTSKRDLDLVLKVLSHVLPVLIYTMNYNAYYFNAKKVKLMMTEVCNDWNALDDKREIEIIEKYTYFMNIYTISIMVFLCICMVLFVFLEIWPIMLDFVVPLNESRPRKMHVVAEYFIDREKYFPFMLLHEIVACLVGGVTLLSTGTICMIYASHVCGMLKIVSFRIEHALGKNVLQHSTSQVERIICGRIVRAVELHRKILKFFDFMISTFVVPFGILIVIGVTSATVNLYRLLQPSTMKNISEFTSSLMLLIMHFLYMFVANFIGQIITDHSTDIYNTTCNVLWYVAPLSSQKILLFLMHRTMKSVKPTIGNLFVASLEGFATLSTTSLSYFTMLYSLQ